MYLSVSIVINNTPFFMLSFCELDGVQSKGRVKTLTKLKK